MAPRMVLITHGDLDGIVCALIARLIFGVKIEIFFCNHDKVNQIMLDQIDRFRNGDIDLLWTSDICPSDESIYDMIDVLYTEAEKAGAMWDRTNHGIFVSDHHDQTRPLAEGRGEYFFHTENSYNDSGADVFGRALWEIVGTGIPYEKALGIVRPTRAWDCWHVDSAWRRAGTMMNKLFQFLRRDKFIELMEQFGGMTFDYETPKGTEAFLGSLPMPAYKIIESLEDADRGTIAFKLKSVEFLEDPDGTRFAFMFSERLASELAHAALEEHPRAEYAAVINMNRGTVELRARDKGYNVGVLAKRMGGGGRQATAGYPIDIDDSSLLLNFRENFVQHMELHFTKDD